MLGATATAILFAAAPALASIHEIWWDITYLNANPDGLFERRVVGINGTWPYVVFVPNNTIIMLLF